MGLMVGRGMEVDRGVRHQRERNMSGSGATYGNRTGMHETSPESESERENERENDPSLLIASVNTTKLRKRERSRKMGNIRRRVSFRRARLHSVRLL
jgi:hypothetical protein